MTLSGLAERACGADQVYTARQQPGELREFQVATQLCETMPLAYTTIVTRPLDLLLAP